MLFNLANYVLGAGSRARCDGLRPGIFDYRIRARGWRALLKYRIVPVWSSAAFQLGGELQLLLKRRQIDEQILDGLIALILVLPESLADDALQLGGRVGRQCREWLRFFVKQHTDDIRCRLSREWRTSRQHFI